MKTIMAWIGAVLLFALLAANASDLPPPGGHGPFSQSYGDQITTTSSSMTVPCYPPSYLLFRQGTDWIENADYYIPLVDQFRANVHDIITKGNLPSLQYLMDYEALTCHESHNKYNGTVKQATAHKHYRNGMRYAYEEIGTLLFAARGDWDNESVKYRETRIANGEKRLDRAFEEFALYSDEIEK